jgi:hypothetical protein
MWCFISYIVTVYVEHFLPSCLLMMSLLMVLRLYTVGVAGDLQIWSWLLSVCHGLYRRCLVLLLLQVYCFRFCLCIHGVGLCIYSYGKTRIAPLIGAKMLLHHLLEGKPLMAPNIIMGCPCLPQHFCKYRVCQYPIYNIPCLRVW